MPFTTQQVEAMKTFTGSFMPRLIVVQTNDPDGDAAALTGILYRPCIFNFNDMSPDELEDLFNQNQFDDELILHIDSSLFKDDLSTGYKYITLKNQIEYMADVGRTDAPKLVLLAKHDLPTQLINAADLVLTT